MLRCLVWGLVGTGVNPAPPALLQSKSSALKVIVSRSHAGRVNQTVQAAFASDGRRIAVEPAGGAGFKVLRVLNASADFYVHVTAVKKWDICAGDAIIRAASGKMTALDGSDITYFTDDPVQVRNGLLVTRSNHYLYLRKLKSALEGV